jgi:peptidoglycan hydrolase-like protein with peptidoglycan-binding domain
MNNENVENVENVEEVVASVNEPNDIVSSPQAVVEQQVEASEPVAAAAAAPVTKAKKPGRQPSSPGAAVSGNDVDQVLLSSCVFKNKFARKSLSIHHVQRRLTELGYAEAATDNDGWYGDDTAAAVAKFQAAEGLEATGAMDMATLNAMFHDDPNVVVGA